MFKKLWEAFKTFCKRCREALATSLANPDTGSTVDPVQPDFGPIPPPPPTPVYNLDTKEGYEAWRNTFPPSTQSFIPTWEQKLEIDARNAANSGGAPVDRTGFELNEANGYIVQNTLVNGQAYTFYLGKSGTVNVFGVSGNQINKVNGVQVIYEAQIPNCVDKVTVVVESVNGNVGVQVV